MATRIVSVKVEGLSKLQSRFTKISSKSHRLPFSMTREMALHLKRRVKQNIPHTSLQGAGHTTPAPLASFLHFRGSRSNGYAKHDVFFAGDKLLKKDGVSKGTLSSAVEFGTRPHPIGRINHPGAKATHFFRRSVKEFNSQEKDKIVNKYIEDLIRR